MFQWQYLFDPDLFSLTLFSLRRIDASLSFLLIDYWFTAFFNRGAQQGFDILDGELDRISTSSDS